MSDKITRKITEWRWNPPKFVVDAFGVSPTWQQKELLTALVSEGPKGIAIRSGHGTGKSAALSWSMLWFLLTRPGAKILATAPSRRQLRDILWAEAAMWAHKAIPVVRDMLDIQAEKITVQGRSDWFARAASINTAASPDEQAETLAGYHHSQFMAIIDEASRVPEPVFLPIEGSLTKPDNLAIMASNPTRASGYFWRVFNDHQFGTSWRQLHWNSAESPIVDPAWVEQMAAKYGEDSDTYKVRVLGEFPTMGEESLIPIEWIRACIDPDLCEEKVMDGAGRGAPVYWGLDVALEGKDKTALVRRCGDKIYQLDTLARGDTIRVTNWVLEHYHNAKLKPNYIMVDVTGGAGKGPADQLRRSLPAGTVVDVMVSTSAYMPDYYFRLRDELWWRVRTGFEFRQWRIPNHEGLIRELASISFKKLDNSGKIKIESKAAMRGKKIASPDLGDAFCLTTYFNGTPGMGSAPRGVRRRRQALNWKVA